MKYLQKGFTLIELMITIAVMGILLALAIPEFQRFIQRAQIDSEILDLQSLFMNARGEAIKTGQDVWLNDGTSGSDRWLGQLRYFRDDGNQTQDPLELAAGQYRIPKTIALDAGASIKKGVGYNSRGELTGDDNTVNGSLNIRVPKLIDSPNHYVGKITFARTGRTTFIRFKNPVLDPDSYVSDGGWN